jgi:hypothetical protein
VFPHGVFRRGENAPLRKRFRLPSLSYDPLTFRSTNSKGINTWDRKTIGERAPQTVIKLAKARDWQKIAVAFPAAVEIAV